MSDNLSRQLRPFTVEFHTLHRSTIFSLQTDDLFTYRKPFEISIAPRNDIERRSQVHDFNSCERKYHRRTSKSKSSRNNQDVRENQRQEYKATFRRKRPIECGRS